MVALIAFLSAPLIHEAGHFDESGTWVPVCAVEGEDGSCWTAHGLSEEQCEELKAWVPTKVVVVDSLPEGWKAKEVEP